MARVCVRDALMVRGSLVGNKVYFFLTLFFISHSPIHRISNSFRNHYERLFFSVVTCIRLNMNKETEHWGERFGDECMLHVNLLTDPT